MDYRKISKNVLIQRIKRLGAELGRKPQKRDDATLNSYGKKLFGSWNNLMKSAGYKVYFYQKIDSFALNEDFAYFLGLLITDGHIYYNKKSKQYKVAIYTSYPNELRMILRLIKDIFKYDSAVSSRLYGFNKKPNYEVRIASKRLADTLINDIGVPSGAKSLTVLMPNWVVDSNRKIKMAFLRGVIDGDGSILKSDIKIVSGSVRFLEGLKIMLNGLLISSGKISLNRKGSNTFAIRINKRSNLTKINEIYDGRYFYERKKALINKV